MEEGLWGEVLSARYGDWRNLNVNMVQSKQSQWWKDLCKVCGNEQQGKWFDSRLLWSLGDGRNVKFWKDRWVDCKVLKEEFPRLFTISQCKDSEVFDVVDWGQSWSGRCSSWNLSWRSERFEWEKHLEGQLLGLISSVQWNKEGKNRLKWTWDDQQVYTTKSGYSILNMEHQMSSLECF